MITCRRYHSSALVRPAAIEWLDPFNHADHLMILGLVRRHVLRSVIGHGAIDKHAMTILVNELGPTCSVPGLTVIVLITVLP